MIPKFTECYIPVLTVLCDKKDRNIKTLVEDVANFVGITPEDRETLTKNGSQQRYRSNIQWAITDLSQAGFIDRTARGVYAINAEGLAMLADNPAAPDREYLEDHSEKFRAFMAKKGTRSSSAAQREDYPCEEDEAGTRYWLYAPGDGATEWQRCLDTSTICLGWEELGDFSEYASQDEIRNKLKERLKKPDSSFKNDSLAVWNFRADIKPGDVIFAKKGVGKILGKGIVEGGYEYDGTRGKYPSTRKVRWTHTGEWEAPKQLVQKTLTDITTFRDLVRQLNRLFSEELKPTVDPMDKSNSPNPPAESYEPFSKQDFLDEVFLSEEEVDELVNLLRHKQNIILQGAPGVGKTFTAKRLAYLMMGEKDPSKVEIVQFHQNFSYEDFIMGYKPTADGGFKLVEGKFIEFCRKAKDNPGKDYFFIIDEINRGNLSKIFGELLMLIEKGYRNEEIELAYDKRPFSVPGNLYLIGMMNTADRSLAMIDYALRRRFAFFPMKPGFDKGSFRKAIAGSGDERIPRVIEAVKRLNEEIAKDDSLGEGFCIGHSYFCGPKDSPAWIENIVKYEICPMLDEYWFDNQMKAEEEKKKLSDLL